jgi:hypothetical protein
MAARRMALGCAPAEAMPCGELVHASLSGYNGSVMVPAVGKLCVDSGGGGAGVQIADYDTVGKLGH